MIQPGMESLLAVSAPVQAAVGTPASRNDDSNGIFPVQMPQGADLPCLTYLRLYGNEVDTLDGRGELRLEQYQFSAFGLHFGETLAAANAVKDTFIGFQGTLPDGTEVDLVRLVREQDFFEQVPKLYRVSFDVEVWFRNAS